MGESHREYSRGMKSGNTVGDYNEIGNRIESETKVKQTRFENGMQRK